MSAYGRFEVTQEIFPGRAGSILLAKSSSGDDPSEVALKTFNPPASVLGPSAAELSLKRFLVRAQLQKELGDLAGSRWAPILDTGRVDNEAYYATRHYSRSIQTLIDGGVKLPAKGLHAVVTGVVAGLGQIRSLASRPHGNLKPGNVLIDGRGLIEPKNVALTDPASDPVATSGGDAADLGAIGQLIHQIVTGRDGSSGADWSPRGEKEWARLGSKAMQWRDFCRRLIEGNDNAPTIDSLNEELRKLRPASNTVRLVYTTAASVAAAAVLAFFATRTTHNFNRDVAELNTDMAEMAPVMTILDNADFKLPPEMKTGIGHLQSDQDPSLVTQSYVFPFSSKVTALKSQLDNARRFTFSSALNVCATSLLEKSRLPIMAAGYRQIAKQLIAQDKGPAMSAPSGLIYAASVALNEQGKIDTAIQKAMSVVDNEAGESLQKSWIAQLNEVIKNPPSREEAIESAEFLENLDYSALNSADRKKALSQAALTQGAGQSQSPFVDAMASWKGQIQQWNAPVVPAQQVVSNGNNQDGSQPVAGVVAPPVVNVEQIELNDLKGRATDKGNRYADIKHELWTAGWKTAQQDNPDYPRLKARYYDLGSLLDGIHFPVITCPIEQLSPAIKAAFSSQMKDLLKRDLPLDALPLPSPDQAAIENKKLTAMSQQATELIDATVDFDDVVSCGADLPELKQQKENVLGLAFLTDNDLLRDPWTNYLTARIQAIDDAFGAGAVSRWDTLTKTDPPAKREIRLAVFRKGFREVSEPQKFVDAISSLRTSFNPLPDSPEVAKHNERLKKVVDEINKQAWDWWLVDAKAAITQSAELPATAQSLLDLNAVLNSVNTTHQPIPTEIGYNIALAQLKQDAAKASSSTDIENLVKAFETSHTKLGVEDMKPIRELLNPKATSTSPFLGPEVKRSLLLLADAQKTTDKEKWFNFKPLDPSIQQTTLQLRFQRLQGDHATTCLLSSEVSFALFHQLAIAFANAPLTAKTWSDLISRNGDVLCPSIWAYDDSLANDPSYLRLVNASPSGTYGDYLTKLWQRAPVNGLMPMQYISPAAAEAIAAVAGCRLPTEAEWRQALSDDGGTDNGRTVSNNLRGTAWFKELENLDQYYTSYGAGASDEVKTSLAQDIPMFDRDAFSGDIKPEVWTEKKIEADISNYRSKNLSPDGNPLFFREVGKEEGLFSDLIGNVAEYVTDTPQTNTDGKNVFVIGGSALSLPGVNPEQRYPVKLENDLTEKTVSFSDVGFRLAFDAPIPVFTPTDKIQTAIWQLRYHTP